MKNFKYVLTSIILSLFLNFSFLFLFSFLNTKDAPIYIIGISIISTIIFCTLKILDKINLNK